jgi:hypothetical protein
MSELPGFRESVLLLTCLGTDTASKLVDEREQPFALCCHRGGCLICHTRTLPHTTRTRRRCCRRGTDDGWPKPFAIDDVLTTVERLVSPADDGP